MARIWNRFRGDERSMLLVSRASKAFRLSRATPRPFVSLGPGRLKKRTSCDAPQSGFQGCSYVSRPGAVIERRRI